MGLLEGGPLVSLAVGEAARGRTGQGCEHAYIVPFLSR
jgi:hypothetical protein